jgi:outer membrane protein
MNTRLLTALLTGAACISLVLPARAQSKLATINLQKVFDTYWKTKQADGRLQERNEEFKKTNKELTEGYQKANEEYKKLIESAGDQAMSADEREKRKKQAEVKLSDIQGLESQIRQFQNTARSTLIEEQRRLRDTILEQIRNVIIAKAKKASYSLVLDTAAQSKNETLVVLYSNGENDMTEDVLKELNKDAPAEFLKPSDDKPAFGDLKTFPDPKLDKKTGK